MAEQSFRSLHFRNSRTSLHFAQDTSHSFSYLVATWSHCNWSNTSHFPLPALLSDHGLEGLVPRQETAGLPDTHSMAKDIKSQRAYQHRKAPSTFKIIAESKSNDHIQKALASPCSSCQTRKMRILHMSTGYMHVRVSKISGLDPEITRNRDVELLSEHSWVQMFVKPTNGVGLSHFNGVPQETRDRIRGPTEGDDQRLDRLLNFGDPRRIIAQTILLCSLVVSRMTVFSQCH